MFRLSNIIMALILGGFFSWLLALLRQGVP